MARSFFKRMVSRMVKPTCPACGADIPPDDMNMLRSTMLCRACGRLGKMSWPGNADSEDDPVVGALAETNSDAAANRRPSGSRARVKVEFQRLTIDRRLRHLAASGFLGFWLIGWTVGCVFLVRHLLSEQSIGTVLFVIPFLAGWFFGVAGFVNSLFGRERLIVSPSGIEREGRAIVRYSCKRVDLHSLSAIERFSTREDGETGFRSHGLSLQTGDGEIRFANGASDEELIWLARILRDHVQMIDPTLLPRQTGRTEASCSPDTGGSEASARPARAGCVVETLEPGSPPHERPAEAGVTLERSLNRTVFRRALNGAESWRSWLGTVAGLAFVNAFWNGGVGLFVYQLFTDFEWFLFFFLIPFEAIGLGLFIVWMGTLSAPLWRETWTFRPGETTHRFSVLGIGRTRRNALRHLQRVELRRKSDEEEPPNRLFRAKPRLNYAGGGYDLALVAEDGTDLILFGDVTANTARWIADRLFQDFRQWFVKVG